MECVTCHTSVSQAMVGFSYSGGGFAAEKVGGRSVMTAISDVGMSPLRTAPMVWDYMLFIPEAKQ